MADTYKCLGQSHPSAASSTTLYTCPSATKAIVSVIYACNQSTVPTSIRVGVDVGGGGDANTDYIAYDLPIGANETIEIGRGIILSATDLLRVYCTLATVSFNAFGVEKT